MSASTILRNIIVASPANAQLAGRVYPTIAPQNAPLPHAVVLVGGERRGRGLSGTERMSTTDCTIAVKAGSNTDAELISRAISAAIVDATGVHAGLPFRVFSGNGGGADYIERERAHRRLIVCEVVLG